MQERAERIGGSLTIVTAPRAGTEVVLAWEPAATTHTDNRLRLPGHSVALVRLA